MSAPRTHLTSSSLNIEGSRVNQDDAVTTAGDWKSSHAAMYVTRSRSAPNCLSAGDDSKSVEGGVVRASSASLSLAKGNELILLRKAS